MTTWKERITEAEKRGKFTNIDKELAMSFRTCAVGEKTGGITPMFASRLESLGLDFTWHVEYDEISQAKKIYKEIQKA